MKKWIAAVALIAGLAALAGAADKSADDILRKMDAAEKNINTLAFDYSQEIVYSLTNERQFARGSVSCLMPNKLAVRQTVPLRQDIISDGKKVWVYTPEYRQVLVDTFKRWAKGSMVPTSLISVGRTAAELGKKYDITVSGEEGNMVILALAPRAKDNWRMKLWIDMQTYLPQRAVLDGDDIMITLSVSGYRINAAMDAGTFTFTRPAGVEEIKIP